ncbi:MAG: Outer membrane efflux protein [Alphaproteobacteria bacterium ADurb.BinA305]|nr:MAG: Outer membrane efflux protein [Alphaproteobacteria bacterium ADurb.BinA305]
MLALENGIIDKARSALTIAESAYRFGERGILEFLDAQRQFRLVRNELIEARFETYAAKAELERLSAREIRGE